MAAPLLPQAINVGLVQLVNATGTVKQTLLTAGANGSKVVCVDCTSTDSAARTVELFITRAAVDYGRGSSNVPLLAGHDPSGGTPSVDLLLILSSLALDNDGQKYFLMKSGDVLKCAVTIAVSVAKQIDVFAYGADL